VFSVARNRFRLLSRAKPGRAAEMLTHPRTRVRDFRVVASTSRASPERTTRWRRIMLTKFRLPGCLHFISKRSFARIARINTYEDRRTFYPRGYCVLYRVRNVRVWNSRNYYCMEMNCAAVYAARFRNI